MQNRQISWDDFAKIDIRTGTIVSAEIFHEARNPAYILHIDFGPLGIKKTSAQITKLYAPDTLVGQRVVAVVNFPPKQIANIMSECLVLGALGESDSVTLIQTEQSTPNGLKIS